jgi:mono/diheme cytochrome c family protein
MGERLFKKNCSGCHINGGNLIKVEKPIIGSKKILSKAVFKDFIDNPPPPMPKFKNLTSNQKQLDELYVYVSSLMGK